MNLTVMGTFSGMTAAVTLLTQVVKQFIKVDPKWIALAIAGVAVTFVQLVIPGAPTYESAFLACANWLLVTGASVGLFEGGRSVGKALGAGER